MHTDLPAHEAHELLNRLEMMLGLISKYWGHPPVGTIECYVVKDLSHWPADSLEPAGRAKIEQGAGVTLVETLSRGNQTLAAKAVVYAVADHGTPQHEAVHAYCGQTFGRTGPLWYAEGMAEMGQYWRHGDSSVHCHPDYVIEYIRAAPPKPLAEILAEDGVARPGAASMSPATRGRTMPGAGPCAICWKTIPTTRPRFRPLGLGFLTGQKVSFGDTYGAMLAEIAFEYRFFVGPSRRGLSRRPVQLGLEAQVQGADRRLVDVRARRGGPRLAALGRDRLAATSNTTTAPAAPGRPAKDGRRHHGRRPPRRRRPARRRDLQGLSLGEPFPLGTYGSFTPPSDGQLYLRCRDKWNELADNHGAMSVKIKNSGQGNPLRAPPAPPPSRTKRPRPRSDQVGQASAHPFEAVI